MKALFVQHDSANPAGLLAGLFTRRGYDVRLFPARRAYGDGYGDGSRRFPDPAGYDVIVVLGSDWSVNDPRVRPWLLPELDFLREAHAAGIPVLGVCFGGQALALALGGVVRPARRPEIGWHRLRHYAGLGHDLIRDQGPWFCWHSDQFIPPPGARVLAHTTAGPHAFAAGTSWGVQFHPEASAELIRSWLDGDGGGEAARLGLDPAELIPDARLAAAAARRADRLVGSFLAACRPVRGYATYA
jgi:GMP synthase-like glutamine amidotransferase